MLQFISNSFFALVITCFIIPFQSNAQYAVVTNANMQIRASLNNSPLAWATSEVPISINKQTGEFETQILIDNLHYAVTNPNFTGTTGENRGKYLTIKGVIPVYDVVDKLTSMIDLKVEMTANFNNIDYPTIFTFTILTLQPKGFSVMASGSISHSALEIKNLKYLNDELVIILSFTGY